MAVLRRARWAILAAALLAVAGALVAPPAARAGPPPTEYQVKAAFLYNFARYVEWPAEAFRDGSSPIVVAVLGQDPFGRALDEQLEGKTVGGRRLEAKRVARPEDAVGAHIVFVSLAEEERLERALRAIGSAHILSVSDIDRFAERGGVIGFYWDESKVRFSINVGAADREGLKLSSQLLKLARIVGDPAGR